MSRIVTVANMKAAYVLLSGLLFRDCIMPPVDKVGFYPRRMKKAHGYHSCHPHTISVNITTKTIQGFLQIMAHEMIHAALEHTNASDHHKHDGHFTALSDIVCAEMGWPKGSV